MGTPGSADAGTATFTIVSASGFPPAANVRVYVKHVSGKGAKEIGHTKSIKSGSGQVHWENESFKVTCKASDQFQLVVKDHTVFGGDDLGEGLFFVDDQGNGGERTVKAGSGSVVLKDSFTPIDAASSGRMQRG
jgi:hypothetical protein